MNDQDDPSPEVEPETPDAEPATPAVEPAEVEPEPAEPEPTEVQVEHVAAAEPTYNLYASCEAGLEEVVAAELEALGAVFITPARRGVAFKGDDDLVWRANLELRCANRVLREVACVEVADRDELFEAAMNVGWEEWFGPDHTIAVDTRTSHLELHQPQFVSQLVKDAICDRLRRITGRRPSVDRFAPDVPIAVHLTQTHATLSLDTSGARLHRRGYREQTGTAPLKETLAAGMVALTGWSAEVPFMDPMCGSGTIAIEAALMATNTAPGLLRLGGEGFAFQRWLTHEKASFKALAEETRQKRTTATVEIVARDIDRRLLKISRANAGRAGVAAAIRFEPGNAGRMQPSTDPGVMVTNPPYGVRMGEREELLELFEEFGSVLKHRFAGWTAWILTGDKELLGQVGLRPSRRIPLLNGALDCRLARFDLYAGTRRYGPTAED
ncbi:MAG: putative N6-adenine-specific DNA methylase [Myxococcota bacterium]|jgi:putative N6-adenine-specific DNA methylase